MDNTWQQGGDAGVVKLEVIETGCYYYLEEFEQLPSILKQALRKAKAGGFVQLFLDEGENMYKLLSDTPVDPNLLAYRTRL